MFKSDYAWRCKCDDWSDRKKDLRNDYEDDCWDDFGKDDYRKDSRNDDAWDDYGQDKLRKDLRKDDNRWDDFGKDDLRKDGHRDGYQKECWECRRVHCCPLFYK